MEVEFFCGDFEQSIHTVETNCGANIFDKSPKDFSEAIRSSSDSDFLTLLVVITILVLCIETWVNIARH
ncbi:hypothetical protein EB796_010821 [Bugula neritina]|uniref:Uncharacterized protein n=1 Tax=Bugula neritina TaxID=10212 RepID=A0A7J7JZU6_BUGNE|nr:hypothetical protein EB796_010821 [Bugula neritina]